MTFTNIVNELDSLTSEIYSGRMSKYDVLKELFIIFSNVLLDVAREKNIPWDSDGIRGLAELLLNDIEADIAAAESELDE